MLRLHQTFGAHAGRVREIDQEVIRFGRLPTNDYVFDAHADLDASGNHAEIRRESGRWVLVDIGSRNGTLVDGRPVQRHALQGGEEIEFGTGGPRVRVEILPSGARGLPPGPATPAWSPAPGSGAMPLGPASPGVHAPPPIGAPTPPPSAIPTPVWPARPGGPPFAPPPFAPPVVAPPLSSPIGAPPGVGSTPVSVHARPSPSEPPPKLYGQKTVEHMIEAAVSQVQVGAGKGPPPPSAPDAAFIRQVADEAAGRRSRSLGVVLAIVVVLCLLLGCVVAGLVVLLWMQSQGR
jgi:hypothetical protein